MAHTAEDCVQHVLSVFKDFKTGAGHILMQGRFYTPFIQHPWVIEDLHVGLDEAVNRGWVKVEGTKLRLTELGAKEIA